MSDEPKNGQPAVLSVEQPKPMKQSCANCACSEAVRHPQLINQTQLMCRRSPPMLMQMQGQDAAGNSVVGHALSYSPTSADLVCFDGWRPIGTEPGDFKYRADR